MLGQSAAFFTTQTTGRLMSRITNDVSQVQRVVSETIGDLARESLTLLAAAGPVALGGHAETCPVTNELEDICLKATNAMNAHIVGVDLMESNSEGLVVHEVNNTTEFKNTVRVTGIDIPGLMIDYALEQGK